MGRQGRDCFPWTKQLLLLPKYHVWDEETSTATEREEKALKWSTGRFSCTKPSCDLTQNTLPTATSECHSQLFQRRDFGVSSRHRTPTPAHSAHWMLSTLAFQQNPEQLLSTHTCPSCSEPEEGGWHSGYAMQHNKVQINCSHSPQNQSYS